MFNELVSNVQLANGSSPAFGYTSAPCAPFLQEINIDIVPCEQGYKALYFTRDYYNTVQVLAKAPTFCQLAEILYTEYKISV